MKKNNIETIDKLNIELIDGDRGKNYPSKTEFTKSGHCLFLNTSNVTNEGFNFNEVDFISKKKDNLLGKGKAKYNDIILTTRGTVGNVAYIDEDLKYKDIRINSGMLIIRTNPKIIDPYYLYLFLRSDFFKEQAIYQGTGSVQSQLPITYLKYIKVVLQEFKKQKKISSLISAIDKKILINQRIIDKLKQYTKILYDYWFVQFDFPNDNNLPYSKSNAEMVYNKDFKKKIPKDWTVKKLVEFESNIVTGKTPPTDNKEFYNGDVPFICIDDIRGNTNIVDTKIKITKKGADFQKNKYLEKDTLAVTCIASPGLLGFTTKLSQTNQQINSIKFKKKENSYYIYHYLSDYFKFAKAKKGNILSNMNKGEFSSIKIIVPKDDVINNFYEKLVPSMEKIKNFEIQNNKLKKLVNTLIPLTITGQLSPK